jgi:hypothetical protein
MRTTPLLHAALRRNLVPAFEYIDDVNFRGNNPDARPDSFGSRARTERRGEKFHTRRDVRTSSHHAP